MKNKNKNEKLILRLSLLSYFTSSMRYEIIILFSIKLKNKVRSILSKVKAKSKSHILFNTWFCVTKKIERNKK